MGDGCRCRFSIPHRHDNRIWALFITLIILGLYALVLRTDVYAKEIEPSEHIKIYSGGQNTHIIVVEKARQRLTVFLADGKLKKIRDYPCATGRTLGDKQIEGDGKTPSGVYFATGEFPDKDLSPTYGTRAFPLDYPNALDREKKKNGSAIWIHGTDKKLKPNQTNGCVALKNADIDDLKTYIRFNRTPVIIVEQFGTINLLKDMPVESDIEKGLLKRENSLLSGTYHDYLSLYHPDFLPRIAWWPGWKDQRTKINTDTGLQILKKDVLFINYSSLSLVMFDQFLKGRSKEVYMGSTKLFFADNDGHSRIISEEYRREDNWESATEHPIIAAGSRFQRPAITEEEINLFVDKWLKAWSNKDIQLYATFYSTEFKSQKGLSLDDWLAYKARLNTKYDYILVSKERLKIKRQNTYLRVSFRQKYRNNYFKNTTHKTLILKEENGDWKIIKEMV